MSDDVHVLNMVALLGLASVAGVPIVRRVYLELCLLYCFLKAEWLDEKLKRIDATVSAYNRLL